MLTITVEFPLGVYHAQAASAQTRAEWPPSPLRLVGALLAAAHGRSGATEPDQDRRLVQLLCDAPAPRIVAPTLRQSSSVASERFEAAELRGATRWVPRNYVNKEKGRQQAEASKVGVALGELPIRFVWPEVELNDAEQKRMRALVEDVSFLGTSHSPVVAHVEDQEPAPEAQAWMPTGARGAGPRRPVRVANPTTIASFDLRHQARKSGKEGIEKADLVPGISIGDEVSYAFQPDLEAMPRVQSPDHWGDAVVLAVDPDRSETVAKTAATYLLARATRRALLGAFDPEGSPDEAPAILRGRQAEPHCAFVPLADIWHPKSSGHILGIALLFPSEARCEDVAIQRARVEDGLAQFVGAAIQEARYVVVPGVGRLYLRSPAPADAYRRTLDWSRYAESSRVWRSATPVIHSRWRKRGGEGLLEQVAADCRFVGLPDPESVAVLRGAGFPGGAGRAITGERVPKDWRGLLGGPSSHLEISFAGPVAGPVLLGRARHFGLGLMIPTPSPHRNRDAA